MAAPRAAFVGKATPTVRVQTWTCKHLDLRHTKRKTTFKRSLSFVKELKGYWTLTCDVLHTPSHHTAQMRLPHPRNPRRQRSYVTSGRETQQTWKKQGHSNFYQNQPPRSRQTPSSLDTDALNKAPTTKYTILNFAVVSHKGIHLQ